MTEEEQPPEDKQANVVAANDAIAKANAAADRLEKENNRLDALLSRQEKIAVETKLSGQADATPKEKEPTEEEKKNENARKFLKGTGYEDELFPKK